jgi:type IV secretory pathway VirD2 relaxase
VGVVATGRFSDHAEDVTWLWPGHVEPDRARDVGPQRTRSSGRKSAHGTARWWDHPAPRVSNGGGHAHGPGFGIFFVHSPRDQRVLTKAAVANNRGPALSWYKHGAYLQRDGAQQDGPGRGFDAHGTPVNLSTTLARWQRDGDPHVFKVMLSPEHGDRLTLPEFAQRVMEAVQRDLGQPVDWIGITHDNTGHPHLHLCLRGVRDGQTVTIAKSYLHEGIQARAREVATRLLGVRLAPEIDRAAQRSVSRRGWSALDRALYQKVSPERTISDAQVSKRERERLQALAERGLAWPVSGGWQLSPRWEDLNMQPDEFIKKPQDHEDLEHEEQGKNTGPQRDAAREREQEEQQRRIVQIDHIEQDVGWER